MNCNKDRKPDLRPIHGGIHIDIPKTGFIAGELISGQIKVFLEESYAGRFLQVSLEGHEQAFCQFFKDGDLTKHITSNSFNKFLDFQAPIYDFSQGTEGESPFLLSSGQWSIPFQLQISENLQSTFWTKLLKMYQFANVRYNLVAILIPEDPSVKPLQTNQEISIFHQFKIDPSPPPLRSYDFGFQGGCCSKSGKFTLNVKTNKLIYQPGLGIFLDLSAELGQFYLKEIKIKIHQTIVMRSNEKDFKKQKETIFEDEKIIPVKSQKIQEKVYLIIPPNAQFTYDGDLIDIKSHIKLTPIPNGSCDSISDDYSFPFLIGPSQILLPEKFPPKTIDTTPSNWKPNLLQTMKFNQEQVIKIQAQQAKNNQQKIEFDQQNNEQSELMKVNTSLSPLNHPTMVAVANYQHK